MDQSPQNAVQPPPPPPQGASGQQLVVKGTGLRRLVWGEICRPTGPRPARLPQTWLDQPAGMVELDNAAYGDLSASCARI